MPAITPGSVEEKLAKEFATFKVAKDKATLPEEKYRITKQQREKVRELIALGSNIHSENLAFYNAKFVELTNVIEKYDKEKREIDATSPSVVLYGPPLMVHGPYGHSLMVPGPHVMLDGGHRVFLHHDQPVVVRSHPFAGWP
jgi:hypothetical protein